LTQFDSVRSTIPKLPAASETHWPDSTSRTASCLNSSVYAFRGIFTIFVFPSQFSRSAKGYVSRGQGQFLVLGRRILLRDATFSALPSPSPVSFSLPPTVRFIVFHAGFPYSMQWTHFFLRHHRHGTSFDFSQLPRCAFLQF
jgi:hypothetical protein